MTEATNTQEILKSLDLVNKDLHGIGKNQQGYGYKFRGIDDVLNSLNPLFKKHGILTLRRNVQSQRSVRAVTDKYGKPKEYIEVTMQADYVFKSLLDGSEIVSQGFGEGQDTSGGDKASSMATSNSYKYVIFEMFNIATNEQRDSDQVTAEVNTKPTEKPTAKAEKPQAEAALVIDNKPTRFRRKVADNYAEPSGESDDL